MSFELDGFRGLSGLYRARVDDTRSFRGFGALPNLVMSSTATDNIVGAQLDPNAPAPNTGVSRRGMRYLADVYRYSVSTQARALRNAIQPVTSGCIGAKSIMDGSIQSACDKSISPEQLLTPLGVINVLDVPMPVTDVLNVGEDGALVLTYAPVGSQKFIACYSAYMTSQYHIARILKVEVAAMTENFLADLDQNTVLYATEADRQRYGMLGVITETRGPGESLSINDFTRGTSFRARSGKQINIPNDVFTTHWDGFTFNPIAPTDDELKNPGGLYRYYLRGGFLLYKPVLQGADCEDGRDCKIMQRELKFTSGYFLCPDGKLAAASEKVPDEGHGWIVFVTFAPGQWKIKIQMADRGKWASIKHAIGSVVKKLLDTICQLQPLAQTIAQASLSTPTCKRSGTATPQQKQQMGCTAAEIMAAPGTPGAAACDTKVYTCKQGEANCVCTGPSAQAQMQQQAMVAAGAAVLAATCKALAPNQPIPCPPPMPPAMTIPWWVIAGGVAVVGAVLYKRNQASKEA